MRFLLTFLALFTPLALILWAFPGDAPATPAIDAPAHDGGGDAVLDTEAMPQVPFYGELHRLENGVFQRFHPTKPYVVYYVRFRGIEKVDATPRIVGIQCALFDEPTDGRERIRARLEAPYLEGAPETLLAALARTKPGAVTADRDVAHELVLGGGVQVYNAAGQLAGEIDRVVIDLDADTIRTDGEVFLRLPDSGAELRGRGLNADLVLPDQKPSLDQVALARAEISFDVNVSLPLKGGGSVSLRCDGPAIIEHDRANRIWKITLNDTAVFEHPDARGTCGRIVATVFAPENGDPEIREVVLDSDVGFDFDPEVAQGLEEFHAEKITLVGETTILIEGGEEPVRAVVREVDPKKSGRTGRGPLEAFGLADRVLDVRTPRIEVSLLPRDGREGEDLEQRLDTIRFPEGLVVTDREGPGRLQADELDYDARAGRLEAKGRVIARGVQGSLEAERVEVRRPPGDKLGKRLTLGIFGEKKLVLNAAGRLGPLVRGKETGYTFLCDGPIYVDRFEREGESWLGVSADSEITVLGATEPVLVCGALIATFRKREIHRVEARKGVTGRDPETGVRLQADELDFEREGGQKVRLRGAPAILSLGDRVVRAPAIDYDDTGAFDAGTGVDADVGLRDGPWRLHADRIRGVFPPGKDARPQEFTATGAVSARGPAGRGLDADRVDYDRRKDSFVLRGSPARVRDGDLLFYEGPALRATVVEKDRRFDVQAATADGPSILHVRPKPAQDGTAPAVARWELAFSGAARLDGSVVVLTDPARVKGYGADGSLLLDGAAKETRVDVERSGAGIVPRRIRCTGGFEGETWRAGKRSLKIAAEALDYRFDSRKLAVQGPGRLWQGDADEPALFGEAVLELVDDGIRLDYLGDLKVPAK